MTGEGRYALVMLFGLALSFLPVLVAAQQHGHGHPHSPASPAPLTNADPGMEPDAVSELVTTDGLFEIVSRFNRDVEALDDTDTRVMFEQCVDALATGNIDQAALMWKELIPTLERTHPSELLNWMLYEAFIAPDGKLKETADKLEFYTSQLPVAHQQRALLEKHYSASRGSRVSEVRIRRVELSAFGDEDGPASEGNAIRVKVEELPERIAMWNARIAGIHERRGELARALNARPEVRDAFVDAAERLDEVLRNYVYRKNFGFDATTTPLIPRDEIKALAPIVGLGTFDMPPMPDVTEMVGERRFRHALPRWREFLEDRIIHESDNFDIDFTIRAILVWQFMVGRYFKGSSPLMDTLRFAMEHESALAELIADLESAQKRITPDGHVTIRPVILNPRERPYRDPVTYDPPIQIPVEDIPAYIADVSAELDRVHAESERALDAFHEFLLEHREEYELMSVFARALRETADEVIQEHAASAAAPADG